MHLICGILSLFFLAFGRSLSCWLVCTPTSAAAVQSGPEAASLQRKLWHRRPFAWSLRHMAHLAHLGMSDCATPPDWGDFRASIYTAEPERSPLPRLRPGFGFLLP